MQKQNCQQKTQKSGKAAEFRSSISCKVFQFGMAKNQGSIDKKPV